MNSERYIAAIEISSSKILAVVARAHNDGVLDIIAVEQERGLESVKYGIIQNLEETATRIARIIEKLERHPAMASRKITSVFVGLSGLSLRSITTEVSLSLPEETEITDEIIERLRCQALTKDIDNSLEVVDAVPCTYKIGKIETQSPKGAIGKNIKATFELIVCRPEMKRNLLRVIQDKLNIEVAGFVVTALATGHLILTAEEKRLGCMLVDMGAETTTVTIYRNGILKYFATLPMGGRNITRDLTSLSILEERAEELKITQGNAMATPQATSINIDGIKSNDVNNIIVARSEEIVANIVEQIEFAELKETGIHGIICIGGASQLENILELLSQQSNLPCQLGRLPHYVHMSGSKGNLHHAIEAISIAYSGATFSDANCVTNKTQELPENGDHDPDFPENHDYDKPVVKPTKRRSSLWDNISDRISSIFSERPTEDESDLFE